MMESFKQIKKKNLKKKKWSSEKRAYAKKINKIKILKNILKII